MATMTRESEWIDATEAGKILDVAPANVRALAEEGLIGTRTLPTTYKRFRRSDCEALARNSIIPARERVESAP